LEFPVEAVWKSAKSSLALLLLVVAVGLLVVLVALVLLENEDKDIKSNGSCFGLLGCIVDWACIVLPKPPLEGCMVEPKPEDCGCIGVLKPDPKPEDCGCIVEPKPEDCGCIGVLKPEDCGCIGVLKPEPKPEDCGCIGVLKPDPKPEDCGCIGVLNPLEEDCGCIGEAWKANGIPVDGFIEVVLPNWPKLVLVVVELEVLYKDKILDFKESALFCWFELAAGLAVEDEVLLKASMVEEELLLLAEEELVKSWNKKISWLELEALLDGFLVLLLVENTPWTSSVLTNGLADCFEVLVLTLLSPFYINV